MSQKNGHIYIHTHFWEHRWTCQVIKYNICCMLYIYLKPHNMQHDILILNAVFSLYLIFHEICKVLAYTTLKIGLPPIEMEA